MVGIVWVLLAGVAAVVWPFVRGGLRERRRRRLFRQPFPPAWERILRRKVLLYRRLPPALRNELHGHINVFLAEKRFEGCAGLAITDEIRLTIAAEACVLLLNKKPRYYPKLVSVLVYPRPFAVNTTKTVGRAHLEEAVMRAGESWSRGDLVLAWDEVQHGALNEWDGHNVVLHEFAHQLDQEDGIADGAPLLERRALYAPWASVLNAQFKSLRRDVRQQHPTTLDEYGAENPAEFFAVATETFFEQPEELEDREPELYAQLRNFYRVDPARWPEEPAPESRPKHEED